ncbi:uncharacterized protein LOC133910586 [Phragmites australis]|uniref:uncharacterized protein LOC133910586 n=1 Tax=Phragmites australis TaxID=29695 RepID=UPI002D79A0C5|nr:uncharacterized protein LOC133910586 [Phragmites australis]
MEYVQVFNHLAQYASDEVNTDKRKQYRFVNSLSSKMQDRLSAHEFNDFNQLLSTSLMVEFKLKNHHEEKKRKRVPLPSMGGSSQRARTESQPHPSHVMTSVIPRPMWMVWHPSFFAPQEQLPRPIGSQASVTGGPCYNCGRVRYFARDCPYPKSGATVTTSRTPPPAPSVHQVSKTAHIPNHGRVRYTVVVESHKEDNMLMGMLFVNSCPVVALLDSVASHCFIKECYVSCHSMITKVLHSSYRIDAPSAILRTNCVVPLAEILIEGVQFSANLALLDTRGVDIILGMNWLAKKKSVIDCARRTITFNYMSGTQVHLKLKEIHLCFYALKVVTTPDLKDFPMVFEFPDVFPEELQECRPTEQWNS